MKSKNNRLDAIKMIISSKEIGSQDELLQELIKERYEAFGRPPFFHIGGDEANMPSCPDCSSQPYSQLFLEHIKAMNETISSLGARTMMWHDMLLKKGDERWKGYKANGTTATEVTMDISSVTGKYFWISKLIE